MPFMHVVMESNTNSYCLKVDTLYTVDLRFQTNVQQSYIGKSVYPVAWKDQNTKTFREV